MEKTKKFFGKIPKFLLVILSSILLSLTLVTSTLAADNEIVDDGVSILDLDGDGKIDTVRVTVDNDTQYVATENTENGWSVTYDGNLITINEVVFNPNNSDPLLIQLNLDDNDADFIVEDTSTTNFEVSYTHQGAGEGIVFDQGGGNEAALVDFTADSAGEGAVISILDEAQPVFVSAEYIGQGGNTTDVRINFSEPIHNVGNDIPVGAFDLNVADGEFSIDDVQEIESTSIIGGTVSLTLNDPTENITGDIDTFEVRLEAENANIDDAAGNQARIFGFQDVIDETEPHVKSHSTIGLTRFRLSTTESVNVTDNKPTISLKQLDGVDQNPVVEIGDANIDDCGDAISENFCFNFVGVDNNFILTVSELQDLAEEPNTNNTPEDFEFNILEINNLPNPPDGGPGDPCRLNPNAPGCDKEDPCDGANPPDYCEEEPEQECVEGIVAGLELCFDVEPNCEEEPDNPDCDNDEPEEKNPCGPLGDQCDRDVIENFCEQNEDDCVKLPRPDKPVNNDGEPFNDVPADHPLHDEVVRLFEMGVIEGRGPGEYAPDMGLTRAEVATLAVRLFNIPQKQFPSELYDANLNLSNAELVAKFNEEIGTDFPGSRFMLNDITDHPLRDYVWSAYQYNEEIYDFGVVRGYTGEVDERGLVPYKPDDIVSRAEAIQILQRAAIQWGGTYVVESVPGEFVEGPDVDELQLLLAPLGLKIDAGKLNSVNPLERFPDLIPGAWYHEELKLTNFTMAYSGMTVAQYVNENNELKENYQIRILDGRQADNGGVVYRPNSDVTRAEAAKIILGIWDLVRYQQQTR